MIRLIHCMKARDGVSAAQFRDFLDGQEMTLLMEEMALMANPVDYRISRTLQVAVNERLQMERGGAEAFDALMEIWWESGQDLLGLAESDDFQALIRKMDELQAQFVDFSRSSRFFVEE